MAAVALLRSQCLDEECVFFIEIGYEVVRREVVWVVGEVAESGDAEVHFGRTEFLGVGVEPYLVQADKLFFVVHTLIGGTLSAN